MSQEEIDALLKNITSDELDADIQALRGDDKIEVHTVNTANERLQFAQENGMSAEEIRYRIWYLHTAAHSLWLKHHGYKRQEWRDKVKQHFILHPEHYQLLIQKLKGRI